VRVLVTLAVLAVLAGAIYFYQNQECTIGYVGIAATVTIHGPSAPSACSHWRESSNYGTFDATTTPLSPVICEVQYNQFRYIVRDQGSVRLFGNAICAQLATSP
jgi:hypothetical protein